MDQSLRHPLRGDMQMQPPAPAIIADGRVAALHGGELPRGLVRHVHQRPVLPDHIGRGRHTGQRTALVQVRGLHRLILVIPEMRIRIGSAHGSTVLHTRAHHQRNPVIARRRHHIGVGRFHDGIPAVRRIGQVPIRSRRPQRSRSGQRGIQGLLQRRFLRAGIGRPVGEAYGRLPGHIRVPGEHRRHKTVFQLVHGRLGVLGRGIIPFHLPGDGIHVPFRVLAPALNFHVVALAAFPVQFHRIFHIEMVCIVGPAQDIGQHVAFRPLVPVDGDIQRLPVRFHMDEGPFRAHLRREQQDVAVLGHVEPVNRPHGGLVHAVGAHGLQVRPPAVAEMVGSLVIDSAQRNGLHGNPLADGEDDPGQHVVEIELHRGAVVPFRIVRHGVGGEHQQPVLVPDVLRRGVVQHGLAFGLRVHHRLPEGGVGIELDGPLAVGPAEVRSGDPPPRRVVVTQLRGFDIQGGAATRCRGGIRRHPQGELCHLRLLAKGDALGVLQAPERLRGHTEGHGPCILPHHLLLLPAGKGGQKGQDTSYLSCIVFHRLVLLNLHHGCHPVPAAQSRRPTASRNPPSAPAQSHPSPRYTRLPHLAAPSSAKRRPCG